MDNWVKNTLQAFDDFKKKKKSVWSTVFWHVKVWIFRKYIQYTMHWVKVQIFKKISLTKSTIQKIPSFFFRELQLITVLLLICDSYMSCSTRFVSLKLRVGFSIFHFHFGFIKVYIFAQQNAWTLWLQNIIIPFSIKLIEKPHTVLLPYVWFLSCNNKF